MKTKVKPIYPDQVHRLLIRGTNWVGDAIMSVPALREIRRLFPESQITLLVRPWVKDVYSNVPFVDEVMELDSEGRHRGWSGFRRLTSELRLREFDLAILLPNSIGAALSVWRARIPRRLGYERDWRGPLLTHPCKIDPAVQKVHQVYYYLGILSAAGLLPARLWEDANYQPSIAVGVRDSDRQAARRLLRSKKINPGEKLIGVNPGASYGPAKRWLPDRYASVADRLAETHGARILIFGAANESSIAHEIAKQMRHPPVVLAGETKLGELMALIRECSLLVTNDSGTMHLAAALDVPQLAIFGSTSEIATGPLGSKSRVIKHPVECSPCFLRDCPIDFRCMTRISADQVVDAADSILRNS
jgi:heptosyltransferase-2